MPDKLTDNLTNRLQSRLLKEQNKNSKLRNERNRLQAENKDLFYKLEAVMHSVDKWLDGDELKQDEVNRAITMREKTLKIVENLQAKNERLKEILNTDFIIPLESDDTSSLVITKIDNIKAEAYKECIDKVKEKSQVEIYCDNQLPEPITTYHITEDKLNNLLKKLVGEDNAKEKE